MFSIASFKKLFLLSVIVCFFPTMTLAVNDLSFTDDTDFDLLTADNATSVQFKISAGGQVTNIDVQSNYFDLTIDNFSDLDFNMVTAGRYFKITKISGSNDYTLLPTCPLNTFSLNGTGATVVLRLQVYTTNQCVITPPPGGGGGSTTWPTPIFSSLLINSGMTETFSSDVILTLSAQNATQMMVSNYSDFRDGVWEIYDTAKNWSLLPGEGARTVYVKLKNVQGESPTMSHTIQVVTQYQPPSAGDGVTGKYGVSMALGQSLTINMDKSLVNVSNYFCVSGSLIKLPTDNNPLTQMDSTVYYCGANGKRYVFPNQAVYFSWYADFTGVVEISASAMANIPLGGNVTIRPGARMVKFVTDPKVYAVAKNGVLRWVEDEATAVVLYGENWNQFIDDISDAFFLDYRMGDKISLAEAISGNIIIVDDFSEPICQSEVFFVDFLEVESTNVEVLPLQKLLQCLGYLAGDVDLTGYFGLATEAAVKDFQTANGIESLGYVGPGTRAALNEYYLVK